MKIRAITLFTNIDAEFSMTELSTVGQALQAAKQALEAAGFEVQTTRLVTQPFPAALNWQTPERAVGWVQKLEQACADCGIQYISVGPAGMLADAPAHYHAHAWADIIPAMLAATSSVFVTLSISDPQGVGGINLQAAEHAARIIATVARQTPDGFNNLRFAAIAACPPLIPFFPVAYHDGGRPRWGVAVQGADLAMEAFAGDDQPQAKLDRLVTTLEAVDQTLSGAAQRFAEEYKIPYLGCDWSLAPFPDEATSIGGALEKLTGKQLGSSGTLWAASCLTSALRRANIRHTGYTGLMLPVLEDSILAERAGDGLVTVNDLLLYSAVCGLGLDTVPLPGNASEQALTGVLLDMGALAVRLNKPLTARLLLVPGKQAGDPVEYGFEYFAPGKVLALQ